MNSKKYFSLFVISALLIATSIIVFQHNFNRNTPNNVYNFGLQSNRVVIYREYSPLANQMSIRHGDKIFQASNISQLNTKDYYQPYYLNLPNEPKQTSISFDTQQAIEPVLKKISSANIFKKGLYENSAEDIVYKGSWVVQNREGPSENKVHTAIETKSTAEFEFEGNALEIGMVSYDDRISGEICIDDNCQIIPIYSESLIWQKPYLVTGLENKTHHATLRLLKGKAIDLDWIRIIENNKIFQKDVVEWDNNIIKSKGWTKKQGTLRSPRGYAKIAFDAKGKELIFSFNTSLDSAEVEICINENCNIIDLITFLSDTKQINYMLVPNQINHITIEKIKGRFIEINKIDVR